MDKSKIAPVVLSEYNPKWADMYEAEKKIIMSLVGEHISSIEHIGSTAVSDMIAKPEIDILVGINTLNTAPALIPILESAHYLYYQRFEEWVPERRYFRKSDGIYPLVHIHLVELESSFYKEHLAFRNELRANPNLRERYASLKLLLIKEGGGDRLKYNKEHFVRGVLDELRQNGII